MSFFIWKDLIRVALEKEELMILKDTLNEIEIYLTDINDILEDDRSNTIEILELFNNSKNFNFIIYDKISDLSEIINYQNENFRFFILEKLLKKLIKEKNFQNLVNKKIINKVKKLILEKNCIEQYFKIYLTFLDQEDKIKNQSFENILIIFNLLEIHEKNLEQKKEFVKFFKFLLKTIEDTKITKYRILSEQFITNYKKNYNLQELKKNLSEKEKNDLKNLINIEEIPKTEKNAIKQREKNFQISKGKYFEIIPKKIFQNSLNFQNYKIRQIALKKILLIFKKSYNSKNIYKYEIFNFITIQFYKFFNFEGDDFIISKNNIKNISLILKYKRKENEIVINALLLFIIKNCLNEEFFKLTFYLLPLLDSENFEQREMIIFIMNKFHFFFKDQKLFFLEIYLFLLNKFSSFKFWFFQFEILKLIGLLFFNQKIEKFDLVPFLHSICFFLNSNEKIKKLVVYIIKIVILNSNIESEIFDFLNQNLVDKVYIYFLDNLDKIDPKTFFENFINNKFEDEINNIIVLLEQKENKDIFKVREIKSYTIIEQFTNTNKKINKTYNNLQFDNISIERYKLEYEENKNKQTESLYNNNSNNDEKSIKPINNIALKEKYSSINSFEENEKIINYLKKEKKEENYEEFLKRIELEKKKTEKEKRKKILEKKMIKNANKKKKEKLIKKNENPKKSLKNLKEKKFQKENLNKLKSIIKSKRNFKKIKKKFTIPKNNLKRLKKSKFIFSNLIKNFYNPKNKKIEQDITNIRSIINYDRELFYTKNFNFENFLETSLILLNEYFNYISISMNLCELVKEFVKAFFKEIEIYSEFVFEQIFRVFKDFKIKDCVKKNLEIILRVFFGKINIERGVDFIANLDFGKFLGFKILFVFVFFEIVEKDDFYYPEIDYRIRGKIIKKFIFLWSDLNFKISEKGKVILLKCLNDCVKIGKIEEFLFEIYSEIENKSDIQKIIYDLKILSRDLRIFLEMKDINKIIHQFDSKLKIIGVEFVEKTTNKFEENFFYVDSKNFTGQNKFINRNEFDPNKTRSIFHTSSRLVLSNFQNKPKKEYKKNKIFNNNHKLQDQLLNEINQLIHE